MLLGYRFSQYFVEKASWIGEFSTAQLIMVQHYLAFEGMGGEASI